MWFAAIFLRMWCLVLALGATAGLVRQDAGASAEQEGAPALLPALLPLLAPHEADALQVQFSAPPAPPALIRSAPVAQASLPSQLVADEDAVFPPEGAPSRGGRGELPGKLASSLQGIGGVAAKAVEGAAPVLQKTLADAVPEVQKGVEGAIPILEQTGKELAPIGKQALDIVGPVVVKGAVEFGKGTIAFLTPLAQQAAESTLRAGTEAAQQASATASQTVGGQLQERLGPDALRQIQETAQGAVTAATPLVKGAVDAATPIAVDIGSKASVEGAKLLKQGVIEAEAGLNAYLGATGGATDGAASAATSAATPSAVLQSMEP